MFAKFSYTWQIMGASWNVLKRDTRLLVFPLLSGICCLMVIFSFATPYFMAAPGDHPDSLLNVPAVRYTLMFLFYFCTYFVMTFFNTAIIACAIGRMAGGEPTLGGGFSEAMKRIHLIFGWALVSATVGLVLRMIEDRSKGLGKIVAGLLGGAWSLLTFLVVPVVVVEEKGPFAALKESARLFKQTWGEQLIGNFSFGIIFLLLGLPAWGSGALGFYQFNQGNHAMGLTLVGIAVAYAITLALVQSALQSIFQAAVYMYTQGAGASTQAAGFPVQLLRDAMHAK